MRSLFNLLLLSITLFAGAARAENLVFAADLWCPYNCEPGSERPGFMVEIARTVFAKQGITVEYRLMPWSRAVQSTREGDFDAVIGATLNDAPEFVFPAIEQGKMLTSMWVLPESRWRFQGVASLSDVVLGVSAGYSYGADMDSYIADPRNQNYIHVLFGTKPLAQGLKMLKAERIDVMVEDESVFRYHIDRFPDGIPYVNAGIIDNPTADSKVYVAFSPAKPDAAKWAEILSKGIEEMRASGDLLSILQRYGLRDWRD